MSHVTIFLLPCRMSLRPMSHVEFKKCPVEFRGQGPERGYGEHEVTTLGIGRSLPPSGGVIRFRYKCPYQPVPSPGGRRCVLIAKTYSADIDSLLEEVFGNGWRMGILWPLTPKFDTATWPFLKIDM